MTTLISSDIVNPTGDGDDLSGNQVMDGALRHRLAAVAASIAVLVPVHLLAQSAVTVSPVTAPPTKTVTVQGTGFAASEAVDLYFDTTDMMLLVSSSAGHLSGSFAIPASTGPGVHYVTAIGRHTGDAGQAPLTVSTPWTQFGYGAARLGQNPYENTVNRSNASSLGPIWTQTLMANGSTPAVEAGCAFVSAFNGVWKLRATTGAVVWSKLTSSGFFGSPTLSGGSLFVGDGSGTLYALSISTGTTLWSTPLAEASIFSSPAVAGNAVYVANSAGTMYSVSAKTGAILWGYTTGSTIDGSAAVVGGKVYFGSQDDNVYALNTADGSLAWKYTTSGPVESTPTIASGILYIGSDDQSVYAIRAGGSSPGTKIWSTATGGQIFNPPTVGNGVVYAGTTNGNLYALDGRTGSVRWSFATDSYPRTAALADGVLYFTSNNGGFYALDASSGASLLYGQSGAGYFGGPAVSDGMIYVNGENFGVTAYALFGGADIDRARSAPSFASLHPDYRLRVTR